MNEPVTKTKVTYALCNSSLEPVMHFNNKTQLDEWVRKQKERHGKTPGCIPCEITTTVEVKEIE